MDMDQFEKMQEKEKKDIEVLKKIAEKHKDK